MTNIPKELKYTKTHEWVKQNPDGSVVFGITDHAQALLGDLVYVELPKVGSTVVAGSETGVVESVKAAADLYSPLSGNIVEINEALESQPELINTAPYAEGWIGRIKPSNANELDALLSSTAYHDHIETETH